MMLGVGLRIPQVAVRGARWFSSAALADFSAIADFNRNRYALPTLGSELVSNGTFDTDTSGWTGSVANLSATGQVLNVAATADLGSAAQVISTVAGRTYRLTLAGSAVQHQVELRDGAVIGSGTQIHNTGTVTTLSHTIHFVALSSSTQIRLFTRFSGQTATFDNVSCKEVQLSRVNGRYPKRSATFGEWFAYTAASTLARTYTGADGLLKNDLAADAPRFTWANDKRQLRLENAATNLLKRSEDFSHSDWTTDSSLTVTVNAAIAPDGQNTADKIVEAETTEAHIIYQNASVTSGQAFTSSGYFKAGERNWIYLRGQVGADILLAWFDLSTGTVGTVQAGLTADIESAGSGWYRCSVTRTSPSSETAYWVVGTATDDEVASHTGDGASGVYVWGAQIEVASFASDYIPTTSSAITRAIETCRMSPLVEAILQRSAASVVVRGDLSGTTTARRLVGNDGSKTLLFAHGTTDTLVGTWDGVASALTATIGGSGKNYSPLGAALGFDAAGRSLVANGGTVASDAVAAGTRTTIYLGRGVTVSASDAYGDGYYDFVGISPERLSDETLQDLAVAA